jgi:hypothetical protein
MDDEDEVAKIVMTILADIRADVAAIRKELVDDGGEEEEDSG